MYSLQFAVDRPSVTKLRHDGSFVRFLCSVPLTFATENWQSTYLCRRNVLANFDFSTVSLFSIFTRS